MPSSFLVCLRRKLGCRLPQLTLPATPALNPPAPLFPPPPLSCFTGRTGTPLPATACTGRPAISSSQLAHRMLLSVTMTLRLLPLPISPCPPCSPSRVLLACRENWDAISRDCMQREDCIKITSDWSDPSNSTLIAAGSYLDPRDPLLMDIPSDLQYDQCSPAPILSVIVFCSYMVGVVKFFIYLGVYKLCFVSHELHCPHLNSKVNAWVLQEDKCSPAPIRSFIVLCSYIVDRSAFFLIFLRFAFA